jgi:hypothetical protein
MKVETQQTGTHAGAEQAEGKVTHEKKDVEHIFHPPVLYFGIYVV